ncbi:hypothetical protein ES319_D06G011300v1 [Gossypium barbadense]|uniref:CRAL/TRIO N-terminal domain-containing protein n=1 Tax=Gossypium barbadense TaxID=3634 RepID=A0A5J5R3B8_GOSBA|nr:hypothetical protein ES319_D06G011300v1 [Gossypium barbadense]
MFSRWSHSHHNQQNDSLQHESKVKELRAALRPLSDRGLKYCTDACLRRYLEARNWNVDKSKKMLEETLKWRSTYKPEEIRWHEIAVEGETGKVYRANFHDRDGRTVLILRPGKQRCSSLKGWVTCDSRSDNWFVSGDRTSVNAKSFRIDSRNGDGERVRSIKEDDRSLSRPQLKTLELLLHEDQQGNDEMNRYDGTKDISRKSSKKLYEILDVENINMEANITIVKGNDEMIKKFHDIPYDENIKKLNTTRSANSTNMEATTRVKVHHADEKNKKLHEILDDGNIKEPNTTKRANSNNIEAITTRAKGSPRNSWDNGKSKVRGKVKEFIKIFNQDASPKPENEPNHLQMNENEVKFHMPTMQEKKPSSQVAIADHMSKEFNYLLTLLASVSNGFNTVIEDPAKSSEDNFLIEDQTPEEKIFPDFGIDPEEIKAIDAKIQQWSNGKQGNIRSLLSTLQYVLWPNSGWKPVPLMDIIEGPAVKRSYQKALLCLHPDKLQQKGAASDQKYIAQIVFDFLQDAWAHFNSVGLM